MGVIINAPDPFGEYAENELDNLIEESLQNREASPRKQRKSKTRSPAKPMGSMDARRLRGNRRNRRYENATFLSSLAESQDFGEVSIHDFVPETISAFAQVLMEENNINTWNNFISCSEEEQEEILQGFEKKCKESKENNETGNQNDVIYDDKRQIHPAFTPDFCFARVESKFRVMLKKRQFPMGNLAYLEEELISFFLEWPHSVYISDLTNSFDRLLLHALCQYLDLHSKSFNCKGGRQTQVKNPKNDFCLPSATLTSYLETRYGANS